jgi:CheY-like chemotaxis protein
MAKILIAEDDATMRKILSNKFENANYNVVVASDGKEALDLAFEKKPEVILLDIFMPKMNGWEVMENLRKDGAYGRHVKIIVFTNSDADNDDDLEKIERFKPTFFIRKIDFSLEALVEKVEEVLNS